MKYVKISGMHMQFLLEHLEFIRVNVEPVYIGPLMDDTPKTINRSPPTAQTEALSSLSEGVSLELKTKLDQMTTALLQLTTMIPNNPENQAALANIRTIIPQSQSAGSSSDAKNPGPSGSGTLPV
jgi:hypothetical protein